MIIDLEDKEESGWFDLRDGGRIHLRLLSSKDVREIGKATRKTVSEYPLLKDPATGKDGYQRFERQEFNFELFYSMRLDRNILGWEKLFDRNKKEIPVTQENKVLLYERVPEFRDTVEKGLKALKDAETARVEASEKNSLTPQG